MVDSTGTGRARGAPPLRHRRRPATATAPFADDQGRFVKRGKRIRRFPHLWQIDEMDCGATSLAIVCRYFGKAISLARIRQLVHTALDGASLKAICEGANELGLAARAVKASPASLDQMPLPGDHPLGRQSLGGAVRRGRGPT